MSDEYLHGNLYAELKSFVILLFNLLNYSIRDKATQHSYFL